MKRRLLWPPYHTFMAMLKFVGLRDRLRCPRCKAVGTWKPHGSFWFDREDQRAVRRWMCKWCGLYVGPEGQREAVVNPEAGVWQLDTDYPDGTTPAAVIERSEIPGAWPWRG